MSDPFLTVPELASMWRPMKGAEETAFATLLIMAASNWIRDKKPFIDDGDPAAKLVVLAVVKAALLPGDWQGVKSWTRTVDDATTAAVLSNPDAHLDFEAANAYELLGLARNPFPVGYFGD